MSRDRGGDDQGWATTGIWEGSTEQARLTRAILADQEARLEDEDGEQH